MEKMLKSLMTSLTFDSYERIYQQYTVLFMKQLKIIATVTFVVRKHTGKNRSMICYPLHRNKSFTLILLVVVSIACSVNGQLCQKAVVAGRAICKDTAPFIDGLGRCARSAPLEYGKKGCGFIGSGCRCQSNHVLNMVATNSTAISQLSGLIGRK
ncbi:uncharacterized protein LOC132725577 [Ruditapes philippinarum]|uniref:uncharacterized protein LOC132725577 n=1 Tax=Ruditapes philippinarum TaxID=129788 RepID=UPI00295AD9F1|nr:uncharacterized protein LOC132725577 [Ruditapes philippinarum]